MSRNTEAWNAIEMGLDMVYAPDGVEWEDSIYEQPDINKELWGEKDTFGRKKSIDFDANDDYDFENSLLKHIEDKIGGKYDCYRLIGTNLFFFNEYQNALDFSKKHAPSRLKIANNYTGYFVESSGNYAKNNIGLLSSFKENGPKPTFDVSGNLIITLSLLLQEIPISDIAKIRNYKNEESVLLQVSELVRAYGYYFEYLRPSSRTLSRVSKACCILLMENDRSLLLDSGLLRLKELHNITNIDYQTIRLSMLFLNDVTYEVL
jgi:hypothetical protein